MRKNTALVTFKSKSSLDAALKCKGMIQKQTGLLIDKYLKGTSLQNRNLKIGESRIYIGYVPKDLTDAQFQSIFMPLGDVVLCYLNHQSNKSNGHELSSLYGFVTFKNKEKAAQLVESGLIEIPHHIKKQLMLLDYQDLKKKEWENRYKSEEGFEESLYDFIKDVPPKGFLQIKDFKVRSSNLQTGSKEEESTKKDTAKPSPINNKNATIIIPGQEILQNSVPLVSQIGKQFDITRLNQSNLNNQQQVINNNSSLSGNAPKAYQSAYSELLLSIKKTKATPNIISLPDKQDSHQVIENSQPIDKNHLRTNLIFHRVKTPQTPSDKFIATNY